MTILNEIDAEVEKMISGYSVKISNTEKLLNCAKLEIQQLRREGKSYQYVRTDQARLFAQLAAYHQAQADFDSLLDYTQTKQAIRLTKI